MGDLTCAGTSSYCLKNKLTNFTASNALVKRSGDSFCLQLSSAHRKTSQCLLTEKGSIQWSSSTQPVLWSKIHVSCTVSHKSTPLTFQQKCFYNFSRDNTAQMKLGYNLEYSMCSLYRSTNLLSSKYNLKQYCPNFIALHWLPVRNSDFNL